MPSFSTGMAVHSVNNLKSPPRFAPRTTTCSIFPTFGSPNESAGSTR
jgi:hypothetical protein